MFLFLDILKSSFASPSCSIIMTCIDLYKNNEMMERLRWSPKKKEKWSPGKDNIGKSPPIFCFFPSLLMLPRSQHTNWSEIKRLLAQKNRLVRDLPHGLYFFFFLLIRASMIIQKFKKKERLEMELASPSPMQWAAPRALFSWKEHQLRPVFSFWRLFFFSPLVSTVSAALVGTSSSLAPIGATA